MLRGRFICLVARLPSGLQDRWAGYPSLRYSLASGNRAYFGLQEGILPGAFPSCFGVMFLELPGANSHSRTFTVVGGSSSAVDAGPDDGTAGAEQPSFSTSANSIPIHQSALRSRGNIPTDAAPNADEIDLEDDVADGHAAAISTPTADKVQSLIDGIVAANPVAEAAPSSPVSSGPASFRDPIPSAPFDSPFSGYGRGGPHHGAWSDGGRSGPRQPWWQGYYDPKSNENPWYHLEERMGLPPRGSWLPSTTGSAERGQHGGG